MGEEERVAAEHLGAEVAAEEVGEGGEGKEAAARRSLDSWRTARGGGAVWLAGAGRRWRIWEVERRRIWEVGRIRESRMDGGWRWGGCLPWVDLGGGG